MRLPPHTQHIDPSREAVLDYFVRSIENKEMWRSNIYGDYRKAFVKHFGRRIHTVMDSANRRLDVWYVGDWEVPFWIISHRDRGTSYEVLPGTSDQDCLSIIERMAEILRDEKENS